MGKIKITRMKKGLTLILLIVSISIQTNYACSSIWLKIDNYYILGANLDGEGTWKGLFYINQKTQQRKQTKLIQELKKFIGHQNMEVLLSTWFARNIHNME